MGLVFIMFGILTNQPNGTTNYFMRFDSKKECIKARESLEKTYGSNFGGFCLKEVK